jgi:hypothetical protein
LLLFFIIFLTKIDVVVAVAAHPSKNIIASGALDKDKTVRLWQPRDPNDPNDNEENEIGNEDEDDEDEGEEEEDENDKEYHYDGDHYDGDMQG